MHQNFLYNKSNFWEFAAYYEFWMSVFIFSFEKIEIYWFDVPKQASSLQMDLALSFRII